MQTCSYFKAGNAALVLVTQFAPNLLAVLQHVPTLHAALPGVTSQLESQPSKDTPSKMLPHYTTNLPFLPTGHFAQRLALKKTSDRDKGDHCLVVSLIQKVQLTLVPKTNMGILLKVRRKAVLCCSKKV
jgi:hypothetical protein